jgi:hypothetical protein
MVVAEVDEDDPRVVRGRAAGKRFALAASLPELARTNGVTIAISLLPGPDPAARQPPPWSTSTIHDHAQVKLLRPAH